MQNALCFTTCPGFAFTMVEENHANVKGTNYLTFLRQNHATLYACFIFTIMGKR